MSANHVALTSQREESEDRSSLSVTEEDPEPLQLPWGQKQSRGLSDIGISGIKSGCSLLKFRHTCS